jgi:hypothetical protein
MKNCHDLCTEMEDLLELTNTSMLELHTNREKHYYNTLYLQILKANFKDVIQTHHLLCEHLHLLRTTSHRIKTTSIDLNIKRETKA